MEEAQDYATRLGERLEARRQRLDRQELPRLKEAFKAFQTAFEGLQSILSNKGVIKEDPYKYELNISEVTTPPESPFAESERVEQMSLRVSQFDSYLDFLNNYYQFSCDFLTMGRIRRLLALVKYFNFLQFTETSTHINTRSLAELVASVRKGSDQLSSGLVNDSLAQLDKASRDILSQLKELSAWHRERYKLDLRELVMTGMGLEAGSVLANREETIRLVKRRFAELAGERAFYPELVNEVLSEDFSSDGPKLKSEVLARFEEAAAQASAKTQEKSFRGVLSDALRLLAGVSLQIDEALARLSENAALLESLDQGFMARLKRLLRNVFSPKQGGRRYVIELADPVTGLRREEELDFDAFAAEWGQKTRNLSALLQRGSPAWKRLDGGPEDQAYRYLEKTMEEIQRLVRRLAALDDYFKAGVSAAERQRVRGIKAEVTTIKGAIVKANQKKHEYLSLCEEQAQMRRLGIKGEG